MKRFLQFKTTRIVGVILLSLAFIWATFSASELYVSSKVPVSISGSHLFFDFWDKGYVSIEGTWVSDEEKLLTPIQKSKINCSSSRMICTESRADVMSYPGGHTLSVDEQDYAITRWDSSALTYIDATPSCINYVYTVNRDTKQVSGIRRLKPGMEQECPNVEKELKLRLTDGWDVYWRMQDEARPMRVILATLGLILIWAGYKIRGIVKSTPATNGEIR